MTEIARILHVSRPSVYRWIERFREASDPESLRDQPRSGRPSSWTEECSEWLRSFLTRSPAELGYFAVNWTVPLLRDPLRMCTGKRFSDDTIRRALRELDYVWKRPRYVLAPRSGAREKNDEFAGKSGTCHRAVYFWQKTRPICSCFLRCARTGGDAANQLVCSSRAGTPVASSLGP